MVLLTAIPMLIVSNFPAKVLVGGLLSQYMLYGCAIGLSFFLTTIWVWNRGLKRYRSASS
jgi:ABC-type uncharacterized transport system permease subunit